MTDTLIYSKSIKALPVDVHAPCPVERLCEPVAKLQYVDAFPMLIDREDAQHATPVDANAGRGIVPAVVAWPLKIPNAEMVRLAFVQHVSVYLEDIMTSALTRERMITFLLETPMFENLEPSELKEVIHIVEEKQFGSGETVFREGESGDAWYVVYRGDLEVIKSTATGDRTIGTLGPKDCFGEIAILDGLPRSATIRTTADVVVLRVARTTFNELLDSGHIVAYKLLHQMGIVLAHRQRSVTGKLVTLLVENEIAKAHEVIEQIIGESASRE